MLQRFNDKMDAYKEFSELCNATTFPWIMHTSGTIEPKTLAILDEVCKSALFDASEFRRDIICNTQFACMRGQVDGLNRLRYRAAAATHTPDL
jgi:hypothetical protein